MNMCWDQDLRDISIAYSKGYEAARNGLSYAIGKEGLKEGFTLDYQNGFCEGLLKNNEESYARICALGRWRFDNFPPVKPAKSIIEGHNGQ